MVKKVVHTSPVTYKLVDLLREEIVGSFYEKELQKTSQETFRVEKVIKEDKKKKRGFVKWSGYPEKFNSWITLKWISGLK